MRLIGIARMSEARRAAAGKLKRMKIVHCILFLFICLPTTAGGEDQLEKNVSALDGAGDIVLTRALVPSAEKHHGEVRLVRRGDGLVVQTLLYSKLLDRVVARIGKKERVNWPPEREGHRDALEYVDALVSAQKQIAAEHRDGAAGEDRRHKMLIEFISFPQTALVVIHELQMEEADGEVRISEKKPIVILEPSVNYVHDNMRLIVADALGITATEAEALFEGGR